MNTLTCPSCGTVNTLPRHEPYHGRVDLPDREPFGVLESIECQSCGETIRVEPEQA